MGEEKDKMKIRKQGPNSGCYRYTEEGKGEKARPEVRTPGHESRKAQVTEKQ